MQALAKLCVERPVFAMMLILSLLVVGAFSYATLGVDLYPDVDVPVVTVTIINPGASPQEVETEITDRVEEKVNTVSGIDELKSSSTDGVSQVTIKFDLTKDADVAAQEVRDKVNLIVEDLPSTAEEPVIQKFDAGATPVLQIAVSAPLPLRELSEIADIQIKQRIENINGVGQVELVGNREREVQILVDPERMRAYNVTVAQVSGAVRSQNIEIPGGRVDEGRRELTVRTKGKLTKVEDFNNIAISTRNNYVVKLSDFGEAVSGAEEQRTASFLNGTPAVTLIVSKQSGENTVAIAKAIKIRLDEISSDLPENVETKVVADSSVFIEASLDSIEQNLILGTILATLIVFLFLGNYRLTIMAALAIPISLISTFGVMSAVGYTLNQITMLSLALMVGVVIDDAIVVVETIFRYIDEKGMTPYQAAIQGTREIGFAVVATTVALLAIFVPVGFMGGIVGRFMSSFGLTSSFAIIVSTLVSYSLVPMLASRWLKAKERKEDAPTIDFDDFEGAEYESVNKDLASEPVDSQSYEETTDEQPANDSKKEGWFRPIDLGYVWLLKKAMAHRWVVVLLAVLVMLSIIPLFMSVGINFTPVEDQSEFEVVLNTPEGSNLPATTTVVNRVAKDIESLSGVSDTLVTIGGGTQGAVNSAKIYVKLSAIEERELNQEELMTETRELLTKYPKELKTSVQIINLLGGSGGRSADVEYSISGPDIQKLGEYSAELAEKTRTVPDATDVDTSLVLGKPEVNVVIDRDRANDLGISVGDIAQALNTLIAGEDISTFNQGGQQYDVVVRALPRFREGQQGLKQMTVPSSKGGTVSLDRIVRLEEGQGPSKIERLNRQRQVTIYANVIPGGSSSNISRQLPEFVKELNMESGYTAGAAGSSTQLQETVYYFALAFILAFIFMYIVLAAQFESFIHPITILLTLPMAVPFGTAAVLVMGQSLNLYSGLAVLLLFGVVEKNAILQIDHVKGLREHGMNRYDAIIEGNRDRLRPILMTTTSLIAGMMPLVVSTGIGSGANRSIGVMVVGGQSLCLLLTLVAVPVIYSLFEDLGELWIWGWIGQRFTSLTDSLKNGVVALKASIVGLFKKPRKKEAEDEVEEEEEEEKEEEEEETRNEDDDS